MVPWSDLCTILPFLPSSGSVATIPPPACCAMGQKEERDRHRQTSLDRRRTKPLTTRVTRSGSRKSGSEQADASAASSVLVDKHERSASSRDPLLQEMRQKAQVYAKFQLQDTASFFGEKALCLAQSTEDVILQARVFFAAGQYRRALNLILMRKLELSNASARLLASQCLYMTAEYELCLEMLGEDVDDEQDFINFSVAKSRVLKGKQGELSASNELRACLCVMRAKVYEQIENARRVVLWYKRALACDIFCYEAFTKLTQTGLLTRDEANKYVSGLISCSSAPKATEAKALVSSLYLASTDKSHSLGQLPKALEESNDVLSIQIARKFESLDFGDCATLCRTLIKRDPLTDSRVVITYLATLVELAERQELFVYAHKLVDKSPREGVTWMAVGYYYLASGAPETARRYLQKATILNPRLAEAWVALGHAYAAQDESDQAVAAYSTASRLYPGAQLPLLFMGMEHARQSSLELASNLFQMALDAHPLDPAPQHELGVIAYRLGDLQRAVAYFKAALSLWETADCTREVASIGGRRAEAEEITLFNLGHCYRRLREFPKAKRCYERALALKPRSSATFVALGLTLHAMGQYDNAITTYHRALRYNPDDAICNALLKRALGDSFPVANGISAFSTSNHLS